MPGPYRISGALFPKNSPNGPVYAGTIEIDGVKHNISIWEKTSKAGNSYLQISEDKKAQGTQTQGGTAMAGGAGRFQRQTKPPLPQGSLPHNDMDDDIPF